MKFYASRDKRNDDGKYHIVHGDVGYRGFVSLLRTTLAVLQQLSVDYTECSFVVKGANTRDYRIKYEESDVENQRFNIYRYYLLNSVGEQTFAHYQYKEISAYLLVSKEIGVDSDVKRDRLMAMLLERFS